MLNIKPEPQNKTQNPNKNKMQPIQRSKPGVFLYNYNVLVGYEIFSNN
jgi:hypothetical protein